MHSLATSNGSLPAIELAGVSVGYRLPRAGVKSLKEFLLLYLQRRLTFDEFHALRDLTLKVLPGERLGVIGRNGAGKSTLLQVIAGVTPPSAGTVMVRRRVAPLLQLGAGFHPELSGRENVFLYGAMLGLRRAETTACLDEIIDFAELRSFIDAPLRTYSSGMEARLGFAVATVKRPDVLLIDEVLAVGDEEFRAKCGARMREFSERGTTLVLVTHDTHLVLSQCTRAIWLESAGLRAEGAPADVLGAYHAFLETRESAPPHRDPR